MQAGVAQIKLMADVADMHRKFGQVQAMAKDTANRIGAAFGGVGGQVAKAMAAIGIGFSSAGLAAWVRTAITAADQMTKLAQKTGLAVSEVAGVQLAFRQSGVEATQLVPIMAKLSNAAVNGSEAFKAMGLESRNADGTLKSTRQLLGEVAEKFSGYQNGAAKTALAVKLFGEEGAKILPLLNQGAAGLEAYDEMARRLGLTLDEETGRRAERFNDTLDLMGQGTQGVARMIAAQLLPTLEGLAGQFLSSMTQGDRLRNTAGFLAAALKGLVVVGLGVAEVFDTIGTTFGGLAAAAVAAATGNFRQAWTILKDLKTDIGTGWQQTLGDMTKAWNASGDAGVAAMVATGAAAKVAAPEIQKVAAAARSAANETDRWLQTMADAEDRHRWGLFQKRLEEQEKEEQAHSDWLKGLADAEDAHRWSLYTQRLDEQEKAAQASQDAQMKAAQAAAAEWQKASDKIEDMLTDALMRGFESGKGFAENLGDSIVNMFKTWVAREIAKAITSAIMAALASTRWGSAIGSLFGLGGAGGGMGNLSTLSSVGGALYQFGTGASVGTSSAGLGYANMVGAFGGDSLGALYTANGGWAGVGVSGGAAGGGAGGAAAGGSGWMAAAGYAALIAAAIAIANNLYEKGYTRAALGLGGPQQQNFMNSSFQTDPRLGNSSIYNTSTERLNLSVLKAVGLSDKWADILSGTTRMATLFGRKLAGYGFDVGIAGSDVNVGGYQYYKGGLFRSDKTRAVDIDPGDADMIRLQVEAVRGSARGMAGAMGLSQEAIDAYTASLRINFKNAHTAEQQAQRLSEAMEGLHFEMLRAASGGQLTKDSFKKMMEDVQASIEQAGISVEGMADIIMAGMMGRMNQAQVGQALADNVLGGIYQTIASPFAQQIAQAFQAQIITPVFTAILAGVPISQAISQQAIANVVATAQQAAATLNAIFSDAGFRQAIGDIQTAIGGIASASVQPAAQIRGLSSSMAGAGRAANGARDAWRSLTDSIIEEVRRLRGELVGDGSVGLAFAQSQFAITTAQARAGDRDAAGRLPELSRQVQDLLRMNSGTLAEFMQGQSTLLASLTETAQFLNKRYRLRIPGFAVGTDYVPRDMLAMIPEGEQIVPKAYNPNAGGPGGNADLVSELQSLRAEVQGLRAEVRADVGHNAQSAKMLTRAMAREGDAFTVREAEA